MGHIDWIPVAELSSELKDGRPMLLWTEIGPYVGGMERANGSTERMWHTLTHGEPIEGVTHAAEINEP